MMRIFFISCFAIFFFACSSRNKIPSDIIQPNEMKLIVWDLIKAGELAKYDTLHIKNISLKDQSTNFFQQVFIIHHTDKTSFYKSYNYYISHPEINKALMDSVSALADSDRNSMYKKEHTLHDSIVKKLHPL